MHTDVRTCRLNTTACRIISKVPKLPYSVHMQTSWYWFIAACLFGVLAFFATDKLIETPPTWFDEGIYIQAAINDSLHGAQSLQLAPDTFSSTAYVTGGFPFLKPISWTFSVFGIGLLQARIVMVVFLFLCTLVFFQLLRRLFGWEIGLMSLALLITFPPLYGQGKNAIGEVPGLLFLGIFLYAVSALERRKFTGMWWYVLAGIAGGLCVATKPIFFLLGGAVLVAAILQRRNIIWDWRDIALSFAAFLLPFSYWFSKQFFGSDSPSAVLNYYGNPYAITDLNAKMIENALRFFHEASPMYFLILMIIWTAAVAVRIYEQEKVSLTETIAFSFAILVWLAYLRTAGWYRYFFAAEIVALVFVPHSISVLSNIVKGRFRNYAIYGAMGLLILIQGYQLLFTSWVATHGARKTSHDLQEYIVQLPEGSSFFVYNLPAIVPFLPSQNYYQYLEILPHKSLGNEFLPVLKDGRTDFLVINSGVWDTASSTYSSYEELANIDGTIFAKRH